MLGPVCREAASPLPLLLRDPSPGRGHVARQQLSAPLPQRRRLPSDAALRCVAPRRGPPHPPPHQALRGFLHVPPHTWRRGGPGSGVAVGGSVGDTARQTPLSHCSQPPASPAPSLRPACFLVQSPGATGSGDAGATCGEQGGRGCIFAEKVLSTRWARGGPTGSPLCAPQPWLCAPLCSRHRSDAPGPHPAQGGQGVWCGRHE